MVFFCTKAFWNVFFMGVVCKLLLIWEMRTFFPILWKKFFFAIKNTQHLFVSNMLVLCLLEYAAWCQCFPRLSWLYVLRVCLLSFSGKNCLLQTGPLLDMLLFFSYSISYSYKTRKKNSKAFSNIFEHKIMFSHKAEIQTTDNPSSWKKPSNPNKQTSKWKMSTDVYSCCDESRCISTKPYIIDWELRV